MVTIQNRTRSFPELPRAFALLAVANQILLLLEALMYLRSEIRARSRVQCSVYGSSACQGYTSFFGKSM